MKQKPSERRSFWLRLCWSFWWCLCGRVWHLRDGGKSGRGRTFNGNIGNWLSRWFSWVLSQFLKVFQSFFSCIMYPLWCLSMLAVPTLCSDFTTVQQRKHPKSPRSHSSHSRRVNKNPFKVQPTPLALLSTVWPTNRWKNSFQACFFLSKP